MNRYLVVGARKDSLGAHIRECLLSAGMNVQTAGVSGEEDVKLDLLDGPEVLTVLNEYEPNHIVCTVGINQPSSPFSESFSDAFSEHLAVNAYAPLNLLRLWIPYASQGSHFVAISSNSAHIARTNSAAYCMSKAALSMGIRCAAREFARQHGSGAAIYGWEFGLLAGTPMTADLPDAGPLTRMEGLPGGIPARTAAEAVMGMLMTSGEGLNGTLLRMDGGEQ